MTNTYCTATNTGKGFFTHQDRLDFHLEGHPGAVWIVGNNAEGHAWIVRVNGILKSKVEVQGIVDSEIETAQAAWDAESDDFKSRYTRPSTYTLN
tara:strand:+ start:508 stop:792 length:285 start_codon:yes stop_codon:yes gene_type:complete